MNQSYVSIDWHKTKHKIFNQSNQIGHLISFWLVCLKCLPKRCAIKTNFQLNIHNIIINESNTRYPIYINSKRIRFHFFSFHLNYAFHFLFILFTVLIIRHRKGNFGRCSTLNLFEILLGNILHTRR